MIGLRYALSKQHCASRAFLLTFSLLIQNRNQHYVTQLEISLHRALINTPNKGTTNPFEERIHSEHNHETK
jgi:hypothetical protein